MTNVTHVSNHCQDSFNYSENVRQRDDMGAEMKDSIREDQDKYDV